MKPWMLALTLLAASPLAAHSAPNTGTPVPTSSANTAAPAATTAAVLRHYADLVHASYAEALAAAQTMRKTIDDFLTNPSPQTLEAARHAWRAAREFYGQTEAFRFYGGPIDAIEGRINAWPMDESYVDYVVGQPNAGLINNRKQPLTRRALIALNERGGEENIATGWHAIEFMLWGQDLSESGPGNRSFEDFIDGKRPNADRRRTYLRLITDLLIDDLHSLVHAWAPGVKNNYRATFERGGQESLRKIFVGLGSLSRGELAGERLEVALASQDQEDEHSCFSDNTHRDAVTNALGIENAWLGRYQRADGGVLQGPGLRDLVAAKDPALAERTSAHIRRSVQATEAIQAPFDREIIGGPDAPGRRRIQDAIDSLTQQSKDLVDAAAAVGIKRLTLVQP